MPTRESFKLSAIAMLVANSCTLAAVHAADNTSATLTTDKVKVISTTPLPSLGLPVSAIPAPVQVITAQEFQGSQALDLSEYLNRRASSVYVNEIQNNPLQPDINYRGFTASPLLGTPQGLSIYVDGVRMNQPFGDVVSWDLIPKNVIAGVQLMPGSNPLFGLNTLGGALSIQTKNGRDHAGGAVQTTFGSYGRKIGEFEYGGSRDQLDWFVAGTYFDENGWRDHSESDAKNLFGKLGWRGDKTDLKLTYSYADTDLNGNGLLPKSFMRRDYNSVYTYPDNTQNRSNFINLQWDHYFTDNVAFSGNAYYRKIRTHTYNGDINDEALPEGIGGTGQSVLKPAGKYTTANNMAKCLAAINDADEREPGEKCSGVINRSHTEQEHAGIFGQVSVANQLLGHDNNYVLGAGYDVSWIKFRQSAEFGSLTADRGILGTGVFATADRVFNLDAELDDRAVHLKGKTKTWSLYGTDTITLAQGLNLTASGRYNHVRVRNRDQDMHYEIGERPNGSNYQMSERLSIGSDLIAISSSYARGNENNAHRAGGLYHGSGKIGGYAVVNLSAAFQINPAWNVFARINNVFDREYATAGMLGANPFDASATLRTDGRSKAGVVDGTRTNAVGETFVAPGAPRTGWIGVRWEFDKPKQVAGR